MMLQSENLKAASDALKHYLPKIKCPKCGKTEVATVSANYGICTIYCSSCGNIIHTDTPDASIKIRGERLADIINYQRTNTMDQLAKTGVFSVMDDLFSAITGPAVQQAMNIISKPTLAGTVLPEDFIESHDIVDNPTPVHAIQIPALPNDSVGTTEVKPKQDDAYVKLSLYLLELISKQNPNLLTGVNEYCHVCGLPITDHSKALQDNIGYICEDCAKDILDMCNVTELVDKASLYEAVKEHRYEALFDKYKDTIEDILQRA